MLKFCAVMDSRIVFVFGVMCVYVIRSSPQAVLLWFRMQHMCPITGLTRGPVGTMKSLLCSNHQACRDVGWETHSVSHPYTHTNIMLRWRLAFTPLQVMTVVPFNSLSSSLLSELYFGEQLRVQTVEVRSKLHTGPQSVILMKRFRINRGEERPTL